MNTRSELYDLTVSGSELFDLLTQQELSPEAEQAIDNLLLESEANVESAAMVVRTLEQHAFACELEADRIRERAKGFNEQISRLKKRLQVCLDQRFAGKVKTSLFTIYTQKNADRIVADLVPGITPEMLQKERPDLVRVKMELNREACVKAWKAAEELPELILFEEKKGERTVRIK